MPSLMTRAGAAARNVERAVLFALVACTIAACFVLVAFNRDSYDDHVTPLAMVAAGHLPQAGECGECYQPKFYYVVAGTAARLLFVNPANTTAIRVVGQIASACAGMLALWVGWRMLGELEISPRLRRIAFALFACNATLIAMFVMASNDAFAIASGALAVLLVLRAVRTPASSPLDRRTIFLLSLACIAVSISKGSGIAETGAIVLLLMWRVATTSRTGDALRANGAALAIFGVFYLVLTPLLGGYAQNMLRQGTPFAISIPTSTPPGLFTPHYPDGPGLFKRPGVLSIVDGYLTLKPFDILEVPWHGSEVEDLSSARTSLWTQVFARSHFVFFEEWPLQWYNTDVPVIWVGRASLTWGWITTGLMLLGFAFALTSVLGRRRAGAAWPALWSESGAALMVMGALAVSLMIFNYKYRDEGAMKAMYMYPGILCAVWAFTRGVTGLRARLQSSTAGLAAFDVSLGISVIGMCTLYVAQLVLLIQTVIARG